MNFKELVAQDTKKVFINPEEFGEEHEIDGKTVMVIIDNNEQIERQKRITSNSNGIFLKEVLFYVEEESFGNLPSIGRIMRFDKKSYTVTDAINENGIFSISLKAVKSSC